MIAFATSLLLALACNGAVVLYSKRRAPGAPLSWGEAMAAAIFAFIVFNLWYGVVPHQWITLADNQWNWRSDRIVSGPWGIFEANKILPLTISYQVLRDLIVTAIYGAGLTLHVFHWVQWNNRSKPKGEVVPATTTYGRPLARKG
ncbi:MAG: hypothetical protein WD691_12055 [Acidimicrobiales bacterium]